MADNNIQSGNLSWGFYGTLRQHGHGEAACALLYSEIGQRLLHHGMDRQQAVEALDSRWGRHLADFIGGDFAAFLDDETEEVLKPADSDGLLQAVNAGHLDESIIRHWRTGLRVMAGFWVGPVEEDA